MLNIVLFEPEIPPNTGNIIRLCANTGYTLHLIEPLGFELDEKRVRRAGLDYQDLANVQRWPNLDKYLQQNTPTTQTTHSSMYAFTTKAARHYSDVTYRAGDSLLFGPETRGLPDEVLATFKPEQKLLIPMQSSSRSLNLSNVVAIASYEAWRQNWFMTQG